MKTTKVFSDNSGFLVRLPEDFHFSGDEIGIQKVGDSILLFPKEKVWDVFMDGIRNLPDDYFEALEHREEETHKKGRET